MPGEGPQFCGSPMHDCLAMITDDNALTEDEADALARADSSADNIASVFRAGSVNDFLCEHANGANSGSVQAIKTKGRQ
jgi:hypothetical protein